MLPLDPWSRTAEQVMQYYIQRPDLIGRLLERLGAQNIKTEGSKGYRSTCPLHNGDSNQAFAIWFDKGFAVWRCHSRCATKGNLVTLLMKKFNASYQQSVVWLAKFAGIQISGPILQVSPEQIQEESIESLRRRLGIQKDNGVVVFPDSWLSQSQEFQHPYFWERGYTTEVLQKAEIGFVPAKRWVVPDPNSPSDMVGWFVDRISIPWRDWDGRLIGFAGRRVDGIKYQKYQNFPYTRKAHCLYGLHLPETKAAIQQSKSITIVEGYPDVWRAWQHGIWNVVAGGGTELSPPQIKLLHRFDLEYLTLYFDGDAPGVLTSRKMSDQLRDITKIRLGFCPDDKDPGDLMTRDAYLHGIVNAKHV